MIKENYLGEVSGLMVQDTADIPSLTNKAYMSPLNEDGGIGPKMGIFGDQVLVTRQDTLTPDLPAVAAAKSGWPFLVIAAGIITLFVVLK